MSINTPHHQLLVVVGLIERDNKILIVRRNDPKNALWHQKWQFPGGKIELHETPADALKREINEETGLTINSERLLGVRTHHWDTPRGIQQTFILLYHCNSLFEEVHLNKENDEYIWEKPEAIILRSDFLDGTVEMFQQLYLNNFSLSTSIQL